MKMPIARRTTSPRTRKIEYPESDGKPMAETGIHALTIVNLLQNLRRHLRRRRRIHVGMNMFFYYEEGNPKANKAPDVYVAKNVGPGERRTFKTWVEGTVPCVIFEITSKKTKNEDLNVKKPLYETLGVKEYFLFDPLDEYLKPRLQGFRLVEDEYEPIQLDPEGKIASRELAACFVPQGFLLRVMDIRTGELVPTEEELGESAQSQRERADREAQQVQKERERADREAQQVQKERERADREAQQAQQERERADREAQQAQQERERATELEAELEQLRAEMAKRDL